jgi:hypothetical protein
MLREAKTAMYEKVPNSVYTSVQSVEERAKDKVWNMKPPVEKQEPKE